MGAEGSDTEITAGIGSIIHADLTVPDAEGIRDFYTAVLGWTVEPFDMGDYNDYMVKTADGEEHVAGICHARGENAGLPPVWLMYINVADLEESARRCLALGGKVLT